MNSKNQFALVTGATSGIEYEIAKLLAKDGYNLVITSRDEKMVRLKAEEFQRLFGVKLVNDDKVISGIKNKVQVAMGNILPDDVVAGKVRKQQSPIEETKN